MMERLPKGFEDNMLSLLGEAAQAFFEAMNQPPVVSVRLNKRKPGAEFPKCRPVKWCESGFYLNERPEFILDPLLHAGAYYVQDSSSMIYETVAKNLSERMEGRGHLRVLDMCAAPGGKTTAMINGMEDGTEFTANEYSPKRAAILRENLAKWGYPKVRIFNKDTSFFAESEEKYDIVAVDAPCSGEGMMRKEPMAINQWSPELIKECSALQKKILINAEKCVTSGGYLIYSTCTFNREENEENAEFIQKELGLKPVELDFPSEWGIIRGIGTELPVYRFMPHRTEGEGLFLAVFRKEDSEPVENSKRLPGLNVSQLKKGKKNKSKKRENSPDPAAEDVLRTDFQDDSIPKVEVDYETVLRYLRRESFCLPDSCPKGLIIVTYKNLPLGLAKNIGSRVNNLYPKNWRILRS